MFKAINAWIEQNMYLLRFCLETHRYVWFGGKSGLRVFKVDYEVLWKHDPIRFEHLFTYFIMFMLCYFAMQ